MASNGRSYWLAATDRVLSRYITTFDMKLAAPTNLSQDQFAGHFALNRDSVQNAANRVQDGAQRVKDGAKQALDRN
jgi:X-X-X-Leu-X-X-Gly heptad repeat protein